MARGAGPCPHWCTSHSCHSCHSCSYWAWAGPGRTPPYTPQPHCVRTPRTPSTPARPPAAPQAKAEKSPEGRSALFARASELLNHAARLDHEEQLPHLGLGQVALLQKVRGGLATWVGGRGFGWVVGRVSGSWHVGLRLPPRGPSAGIAGRTVLGGLRFWSSGSLRGVAEGVVECRSSAAELRGAP